MMTLDEALGAFNAAQRARDLATEDYDAAVTFDDRVEAMQRMGATQRALNEAAWAVAHAKNEEEGPIHAVFTHI